MSVKRGAGDLDPDYQDLVEHRVKRQRVIEKDARQASVDTIQRIMKTHFSMELQNKETEAIETDKRLNDARVMMDRLRAVIIASFYSHQRDEPGKSTPGDMVPSIHPTAKKHLGKAPVGTEEKEVKNEKSKPPSSQQSCGSSSALSNEAAAMETKSASKPVPSIQSQAAVSSSSSASSSQAAGAVPGSAQKLGGGEEEQGNSRFSTKRTIVVGNCSRFLLAGQRHANNPSTHKWMVYVRGPRDKPDISDIVSRVWFFLHPSYRPNDLVEVREAPFHLSRQGWGEFPVRVQVHFHDTRNRRMDVIHNLVLDKTYTGLQTLGAETVVSVDLVRGPALGARGRLSAPSTLSHPHIADTGLQQGVMDISSAAKGKSHCGCGASSNGGDCDCGEGRVGAGRQRVEVCERREGSDQVEVNVTIKEEPPDDPSQDTPPSAGSHPSDCGQTDLVSKKEPSFDQGQPAWKQRKKNAQCFPGLLTDRDIKREDTPECQSVPDVTMRDCSNGVNSAMDTGSSARSSDSVDGSLKGNGAYMDRSSLMNMHPRSDADVDSKVNVQRQAASLLLAGGLHTNFQVPGSGTDTVSGAYALKYGDGGVATSQVQIGNSTHRAVADVTAGSLMLSSRVNVGSGVNVASGVNVTSGVNVGDCVQRESSSSQLAAPKSSQPHRPGEGAKTPGMGGVPPQAVKMVVLDSSGSLLGQGPGVRVVTEGRAGTQDSPRVTPYPVSLPLMKVTAQGLKPLQATVKMAGAAGAQPVVLRHSAVQSVQGSPQGLVRGGVVSGVGSAKPPGPVVRAVSVDKSVQKPGLMSLLKTAVKPGIQALLQKSSPLPATSVSLLSPNPHSLLTRPGNPHSLLTRPANPHSLLTIPANPQSLLARSANPQSLLARSANPQSLLTRPVSVIPASSSMTPSRHKSATSVAASVVPGSFTTGASGSADSSVTASPQLVSLPSSPMTTYVVAQVNKKRVLMKMDCVKTVAAGGSQACLRLPGRSVAGCGNPGEQGAVRLAQPARHMATTTPGHSSAVSVPGAPLLSLRSVQQVSNTTTTRVEETDPTGHRSHRRVERGDPRALPCAQTPSLLSTSAAQLARLKALAGNAPHTQRKLPPPKPRCGRWFSQGLGSCLRTLPEPTSTTNPMVAPPQTEGAEIGAGSGTAVKDVCAWEEVRGKEKRIIGVKKKLYTGGLDWMLSGTPVAGLSLEQYSCMTSLIKAAVLRHPLLAPASEKTVHPYSAVSLDQWMSWHPAKRNACEWSRAVAVRKYLWRYLGEEGTYKGENLWSPKRIMLWCRCCGLGPNGPGGRPFKGPGTQPMTSETDPPPCLSSKQPAPASLSDFELLHSAFPSEDKESVCVEDSSEVEIVAMDSCPEKGTCPVKEERVHVGYNLHFDLLPSTAEAEFVQDTARQVGVKFSPAVLAPGVLSSTAEDMLFGAMMEFAGDLVHHACSMAAPDTSMSHEGVGMTVTCKEVLQAMKNVDTASFLSSQHCGIPNPPASPARR